MTATELQNIARRLSNSTWCRHWLNLFDQPTHVKLGIQCRDENGNPKPIADAERHGLTLCGSVSPFLYTADRTNEDGTPYESKLF